MIVSVEREKTKFEKAIEEPYRNAEEKEKVYPITYKCPICKDKGGFQVWENGYPYWKNCECYLRELAEREKARLEEKHNGKYK